VTEDLDKNVSKTFLKAHIIYIAILIIVCSVACFCIYTMYGQINIAKNGVATLEKQLQPFLDRKLRLENMQLTLLVNYRISKYEARYYSMIYDDFAMKYNIPWEIYPTIVRIESNFNPTARSKVGAAGLTQLMPNTARCVAKKIGIKYDSDETLWNDIHNMVIGFTYLSEGINENGLEHGVKRYLGGPGYSKTEKKKGDMYSYIGSYRTSVKEEFDRNQFIYMGVTSRVFEQFFDSTDSHIPPLKVDSAFMNNNPLHVVAFKDDKNE